MTLSELPRELAADNRNRARIADVTQPERDLLRLWRGLVGELLDDLAALEGIGVARKVRFVSSGFIFSGVSLGTNQTMREVNCCTGMLGKSWEILPFLPVIYFIRVFESPLSARKYCRAIQPGLKRQTFERGMR